MPELKPPSEVKAAQNAKIGKFEKGRVCKSGKTMASNPGVTPEAARVIKRYVDNVPDY